MNRELRVNEKIRIPQLRIVDENGEQLGVMATTDALRMAQDRNLDLVEVAPTAVPPVARFLDYGKFKFEQSRKERAARRAGAVSEVKEIRLGPKIGKGDLDTKIRHAMTFLAEGDKVKVSVRFRGREITHADLGHALLKRFVEAAEAVGSLDRNPLLDGKFLWIMLVPRSDLPRSTEAPRPAASAIV